MNTTGLFIDPQTRLLRSGWRAAVFFALLYSPRLALGWILNTGQTASVTAIDVSVDTIFAYAVLIVWVGAVSRFSLRFFDKLKFSSLGFCLHSGWRRDVLKGFAMSAVMIVLVVMLQSAIGGTRLSFNPSWLGEQGIDYAGAGDVAAEIFWALLLLIAAGAFEELIYRGYAFQTLLRGSSAIVPVLLFSVFFGLAHWNNPSRNVFSTANTVLAGVWLSVAYLKTRSLWFPTALHAGWNWTMGSLFGLPVSGLRIPENPILVSTGGDAEWLTGGSYGSEGGAAATIVLILAIIVVWRARWLSVSPKMEEALSQNESQADATIRLGLEN
jgi:hypothetical protein